MKLRLQAMAGVLCILTLLLTGCNNAAEDVSDAKTAITTEEFASVAQQNGMTVLNAAEQFTEYDYVESAFIAVSEDQSYQIEFYVLADRATAVSLFETNQQYFEEMKTDGAYESPVTGDNYSGYSLAVDDGYMFVEQVDNTVMYLSVGSSQMESAAAVVSAMGY